MANRTGAPFPSLSFQFPGKINLNKAAYILIWSDKVKTVASVEFQNSFAIRWINLWRCNKIKGPRFIPVFHSKTQIKTSLFCGF